MPDDAEMTDNAEMPDDALSGITRAGTWVAARLGACTRILLAVVRAHTKLARNKVGARHFLGRAALCHVD